jgi:hypothetical protein
MSILKHNPHTATWELVEDDWTLQYNPLTSVWCYAPPGAVPRRNPFAHRWELVPPDWVLQYIPQTAEWRFAPRASVRLPSPPRA